MKYIRDIPIVFSTLILLNSQVNAAALDKDTRDLLNAEAASTSMENTTAKASASEPSVIPNQTLDYQALEDSISSQIKQALTAETNDPKAAGSSRIELENALENVVSSALLKGNKLEDIQSAVAAAMSDLQQNNEAEALIPEQKIESAASALKAIVSESTGTNEDAQDAYITSLKAELKGTGPKADTDQPEKSESVAVTKASVEALVPETPTAEQAAPNTKTASASTVTTTEAPTSTESPAVSASTATEAPTAIASTATETPAPSTMSAVDTILAAMSDQSQTKPSEKAEPNVASTEAEQASEAPEKQVDIAISEAESTPEAATTSEDNVETVASQAESTPEPETKKDSSEIVMVIKEESLEQETVKDASSDSQADDTEQASTEVTEFDIVTVEKNETLFKIAQRVYGSGRRYLELYEANKDTLKSPDLIRVGQTLKVPR